MADLKTQQQAIRDTGDRVSEQKPEQPASPDSSRPIGSVIWWVGAIVVLGLIALAVAWGAVQWVERPLAEAEQWWLVGDYQQAAGLADYFLETHPGHGRAQLIKARALTRLGQAQEAAELFELAGTSDARDTHLWAEALLTLGRFSDALQLLQRVIELEPHNADALYEITTCRMRLRQFRDALKSAASFTQRPGCEARGRLLSATIYHDLHNHEQAIIECQRVLELEPDGEHLQIPRHEFFILFGRTLLESGKPNEALPILGRSIVLRPTAEAYFFLGRAADQVGEPTRAESLWQSALKLENTNVEAREALANLAITKVDGQKALEWLKPIEADPNLRASTAYLFQRASVMVKDDQAAATWQARTETLRKRERLSGTLDRFVSDSPNSYWSWVIQSYRFAHRGNWEQAAAILQMIPNEGKEDPFVRDLKVAVKSRSALPELDRIPIKDY